jgi:hypothetical protein
MKEIKIFLDKEKKSEIKKNIIFESINAGEKSQRIIYIENIINYPIDLKIEVEGNVKIIKDINKIKPGETKEMIFELKASLTEMKPIEANLKIQINYVVI